MSDKNTTFCASATENDIKLLSELYKNVKMGSESTLNIMGKVSNTALREELTKEINAYEGFSKKIKVLLNDMGKEAREENIMTKMGVKIGMAMNTMTDPSDSHIAQMVIEGATMGVTEIVRLIRENENKRCSEKTLELAKNIVAFEESTIEEMKSFL